MGFSLSSLVPSSDRAPASAPHAEAPQPWLGLEALEPRVLLANVAPTLVTPLTNLVVPTDSKALTLGLDGFDKNGDAITFTAVSNDPNLQVHVPQGNRYARLHFLRSDNKTVIGDILVQLLDDREASADAIERFVTLATKHVSDDGTVGPGVPYYNDVLVHRVIPGFMIQTGDVENGNGTGGSPLGTFPDTFDPQLSFAGKGALAMANSGPNTNDSQFFITAAPATHLNGKHMIFGQMISGQDVYDTIISLPRQNNDRPFQPPILDYVEIIEDSPQDGTLSFVAAQGWDGKANVTVTLADARGKVTTQTITVVSSAVLGDRPTIPTLADTTAAPGTVKVINPGVTDASGLPLEYTVRTSFPGIEASVDQSNGQISLDIPSNFSGIFEVTYTAVEKGFAPGSLTPRGASFFVTSQAEGDPQIVLRKPLTAGSTAFSSVQAGNKLYVAAGATGLEIFDVTDPAAPTRLGGFNTPNTAREVKVVGNTAFVADTFGGLIALDVTNPASVTKLKDVLPTGPSGATAATIGFEVDGDRLYVAEYGGGLTIYDISKLTADKTITKVGNIQALLPPFISTSAPAAVDVAIKGNFALVSDAGGAIAVVDVSNPVNPRSAGYVATRGSPWGIERDGNLLYVADQRRGLLVYDISDARRPRAMGRAKVAGSPYQLALVGKTAVVANDDGGVFLDLSNPRRPRPIYAFSGLGFGGIASAAGSTLTLPVSGKGYVVLEGGERRVAKSQTFVDDEGVPVTVKIAGGGEAVVHTTGFWSGQIERIEIVGATPKTRVTLATPRGKTAAVGDVSIDGPIKSIVARGIDFTGEVTAAGGLGQFIAGSFTDASVQIDGSVGKLVSAAWIDGTTLRTTGDVAALTAGGIRGSSVLLGVDEEPGVFPFTRGDFAALDGDDDTTPDAGLTASLGKLTITGVRGEPANTPSYIDSTVAAWSIGKVNLRLVDTSNDAPFGLAATQIGKYRRIDADAGVVKPTQPDGEGVLDEKEAFAARVV